MLSKFPRKQHIFPRQNKTRQIFPRQNGWKNKSNLCRGWGYFIQKTNILKIIKLSVTDILHSNEKNVLLI